MVTTETQSDLLIYDTEHNELHTLNQAAAAVWRAADGSKSLTELSIETDLDAAAVKHALQMLTASNLLVNGMEEPANPGRRRLLKKAGIVAIPAIVSVSVPIAAAAKSCPAGGDIIPFNGCTADYVGLTCRTGNSQNSQCGCCKMANQGNYTCDSSC